MIECVCLYVCVCLSIRMYTVSSLRLENDSNYFPLIFKYLEDKGLHGELWGMSVSMVKLLVCICLSVLDGCDVSACLHIYFMWYSRSHLPGQVNCMLDPSPSNETLRLVTGTYLIQALLALPSPY